MDIQGDATMASDNRSTVHSQVHDNYPLVDQRQLYAEANLQPSSRKSPPPGSLPAVVNPIFYDRFLKRLDYDEFYGRTIPPSNLADITSIYAYSLFKIGHLKYGGGTQGKVCSYKCNFCDLRIRFKRKSNTPYSFFSLDVALFPHDNLKSGKHPHEDHCTGESKINTSRVVILNHPFFFDCFQQHLPLDSILAVHLKTGDIVKAIIRSFKNGDVNNSLNITHLKTTAWNSIIDNMIDIFYQNIAREYKTLPRKLVDLLTTNNGISVNLNEDVQG